MSNSGELWLLQTVSLCGEQQRPQWITSDCRSMNECYSYINLWKWEMGGVTVLDNALQWSL